MKTTAARAPALIGLLFAAYTSSWDGRNSAAAVHAFSLTPRVFSSSYCTRSCQIRERQLRGASRGARSPLSSSPSRAITGARVVCSMGVTVEKTESAEYLRNKEALKQDLRHEYGSFFDNFESDRYLPNVEFIDPVTSFVGFQNYKNNLDMLGGRSAIGRILFKDAAIVLHDIEEPAPFRLRTRWTLTVCFKALPWKPVPCFTGISEYTIDEHARVIKQEDFWDSVNLVRGRYRSVSAVDGVKDFVGQLLPKAEEKPPGGLGETGDLLRRAKDYEVGLFQAGGGERGASSGVASAEVVAFREFDGDATEEAIATNSRTLLKSLEVDGLTAGSPVPKLLTPGTRKAHQVCVTLVDHDWPSLKS